MVLALTVCIVKDFVGGLKLPQGLPVSIELTHHFDWCNTIQKHNLIYCRAISMRWSIAHNVPVSRVQAMCSERSKPKPTCALGHKTHSAWQHHKTTKSRPTRTQRRTWHAEPRNVMFSGCIFSVNVLRVIMLHWQDAGMREAFHLCPCNWSLKTSVGF